MTDTQSVADLAKGHLAGEVALDWGDVDKIARAYLDAMKALRRAEALAQEEANLIVCWHMLNDEEAKEALEGVASLPDRIRELSAALTPPSDMSPPSTGSADVSANRGNSDTVDWPDKGVCQAPD